MSNSYFNIATIPGDGIGKDIVKSAISIVNLSSEIIGGYACEWEKIKAGAEYYSLTGKDVEPGGEKKVDELDSIFLGAIGLPTVRHKDGTEICPHLRFREMFGLYAGVRPVKAYQNIPNRLSNELSSNIDLIILRESTEGLFYTAAVHNRCPVENDEEVQDVMRITRKTTEKLHDFAFKLARQRKKKGIVYNYYIESSISIESASLDCDLLHIDSLHDPEHLMEELLLHGSTVKKYIVFHDTANFKNSAGLFKVIAEYITDVDQSWKIVDHYIHRVGYTVIQREERLPEVYNNLK